MNAVPEETYCLLVPLAEERLLVPRACVTEVINYQAPAPMEGAPAVVPGHDRLGRPPRSARVLRGGLRPQSAARQRAHAHRRDAGHRGRDRRQGTSRSRPRAFRSWCA